MASLSPTFFSILDHYKIYSFNNFSSNNSSCISVNSNRAPLFFQRRSLRTSAIVAMSSNSSNLRSESLVSSDTLSGLRRLVVSSVMVLSLGFGVCLAAAAAASPPLIVANDAVAHEPRLQDEAGKSATMENIDEADLKAEFEKWKSKTYALTVPLRIVALHGSVPPSWITDFIQSQGKRVKLRSEIRGNLAGIFSDLCTNSSKGTFDPKSAVAADIVTVGDSWLSIAIKRNLVEPLRGIEDQDWYKGLSDKWKVYLRRNRYGNLDPEGDIWAFPYRWGCMVIAYKKDKFRTNNLAPIEDWADLWRPELAGKISMVDSSREVIGAVLKSMGASYNTTDIDTQVDGGKESVQKKLAQLEKQVRLFDNVHYLKTFGVGDVWVAVGWTSDVIPAAKRMSNVSVIIPKSGASLWADLWAVPATSKFTTDRIGYRVRGPSPLVHQWIEFCLQTARAMPFKQEVIPGASPSSLTNNASVEELKDPTKGKPKLDTNLIAGVPPADILEKCEFLEPLSDTAFADYQWLIAGMQKTRLGFVEQIWQRFSSIFQVFLHKNEPAGNLR